jgi:3-methylcrotonyl-CoA carboxylase alpha subunit
VRVDTGVREGDAVTPFYDPMIAKVIAHGDTRDEALDRLAGALGEAVVAGPKTNAAFLKQLCEAEGFRAGRFDTGFIDRLEPPAGSTGLDGEAVAAGVMCLVDRRRLDLDRDATGRSGWPGDPWTEPSAFQLNGGRTVTLQLVADGEPIEAGLGWADEKPFVTLPSLGFSGAPNWAYLSTKGRKLDFARETVIVVDDEAAMVLARGRQTRVAFHDPFSVDLEHLDEGGLVKAPMHGKVIAVLVPARRPGVQGPAPRHRGGDEDGARAHRARRRGGGRGRGGGGGAGGRGSAADRAQGRERLRGCDAPSRWTRPSRMV